MSDTPAIFPLSHISGFVYPGASQKAATESLDGFTE